jgi:flagellar biosynthesis protein FlgN
MTAAVSPAERLDALLHQAVREACLLEAALERESTALADRDLEGLNRAVAEKHQLVRSLERITHDQTALLRSAGFAADAPGMEACLRDWDAEGLMRPAWNRLQDVMERCRRLNQINGGVVETQRRQTEQAIHILRGEDPRTELYDPSGHTVSSGPSRHISRA